MTLQGRSILQLLYCNILMVYGTIVECQDAVAVTVAMVVMAAAAVNQQQ